MQMCADSIIRSVNPKVISIDYFTEIIQKHCGINFLCIYSLLDWVECLKQSSIFYVTNLQNSNEKFLCRRPANQNWPFAKLHLLWLLLLSFKECLPKERKEISLSTVIALKVVKTDWIVFLRRPE